MQSISIEEAQVQLAQIIERLSPSEELVITQDGQAIATIRATPPPQERNRRQLGTLKGTVLYIAPDFDAIPEGFEECVE